MLRGDPRKSVMPLALPVMVTMIFTTLYNVVDGIWIAGLGRSALAGVGIVTPLWMVVTGVSNGLAQGATSVISRYAASDKQKAEKAAEHAIMIFIAGALLLTVLLLGTLRPFLNVCSVSSEAALEAVRYSLPLFGGLLCFPLSCVHSLRLFVRKIRTIPIITYNSTFRSKIPPSALGSKMNTPEVPSPQSGI